ncbi:hypothetical protein HDU87_002949 [Geranomyces variabilis]|uniref:DUF4604 domain-containing protein n=1 Tax=Geranomyces variabilis TaxID=109894 RepID=A0AAD5XQY5_9FUNG|nr:hypothetical protein HDU87_002949 [Geranomyces variabilis]
MSEPDKKMNFKARQSLQFQAHTPNFLRMLQSGGVGGTSRETDRELPNFEDDDSGPDAPEGDEEGPQIVVEKGITDMEVRRFRGEADPPARKRGLADDDDNTAASLDDKAGEEEPQDDGKIKFRRLKIASTNAPSGASEKRRKLTEKKKAAMSGVKKVKNAKLLSFGEDEG